MCKGTQARIDQQHNTRRTLQAGEGVRERIVMNCENCNSQLVILFREFHEAPQSRPLTESRYSYYFHSADIPMGNKSEREDTAITQPLCPNCAKEELAFAERDDLQKINWSQYYQTYLK